MHCLEEIRLSFRTKEYLEHPDREPAEEPLLRPLSQGSGLKSAKSTKVIMFSFFVTLYACVTCVMVFLDYWYDLLAVINHCCPKYQDLSYDFNKFVLFLDTFCIKCCRFFPCRFLMPQFLPQQWFGLVWICRFSMISTYFCLWRFALLPGKIDQDCCRFLSILGSKSELSVLTTPLFCTFYFWEFDDSSRQFLSFEWWFSIFSSPLRLKIAWCCYENLSVDHDVEKNKKVTEPLLSVTWSHLAFSVA